MRRSKAAASLLAFMVLLSGCTMAPPVTEETEETSVEVYDFEGIRAQDDFYGFINAENLLTCDIEDTHGMGGPVSEIDIEISDRLEGIIHEIVNGDRDSYAPGSNEQLIYDYYYQALEASTGGSFASEDDIAYVNDVISGILSVSTIDEYLTMCGDLYTNWGVDPIIGGGVDTDLANSSAGSVLLEPFSSPDGSTLENIGKGGTYAQVLASSIRMVLIDFGVDPEEAEQRSVADASLVLDIAYGTDIELIKALEEDFSESMNRALFRTNDEIDALCPNIGIDGFMKTLGMDGNPKDGVYIWDEGQLATIDSLLTDENLECWKDIAILRFVREVVDYLPDELGGSEVLYENDYYAIRNVEQVLETELGEEYAERYLDEQTVEDVTNMAETIRDEYIVIISDCEWLSDEGKELIIAKLNNMLFFIGADEPHEVDPEDADLIGDTVFDTMHNINIRRYEDKIDKLTDGNERNGFIQMSPQTVNACYMPDINSINITLGIMSAPFYDRNNTYWQNLGGIGTVVGHEISHAFDNTGMLYDMYGNYAPDWIPECDRDAFDEMASHISDYYSGLTILDIHPVDGELTLGENLADISGVQCVLEIAENNEQRQQIFEQYALIWGYTMPKDSALDYLYLDVHSPNVIRVNAVVPLFDCFYEIYGVEEGDGMYVAPSDRVRRW
ncbi:MAG: M13 family metallopeptidase [Clostridiales bacterium]|nr:M13 family metallopeptidase [Clostridiales bacterium]